MKSQLTNEVLTYQKMAKSTVKAKALYHYLCNCCRLIFYTYPVEVRLLDQEDALELLLSMEGRLEHLINDFEYRFIPFETYVKKVAYLQGQIFLKLKLKAKRKYSSVFRTLEELDENVVSDYDEVDRPIWDESNPITYKIKNEVKRSKTFRERLIQLVIKCSDDLSIQQLSFIANFLEIDELELAKMITKAHQLSEFKRIRTKNLLDVRNRHYTRTRFLKQEIGIMEAINADAILIERLKVSLQRSEENYEKACEAITKRPNSITHSTLSKVMELPKGTIDSGMFNLKKELAKLIDA
ncbi:MAG: hypothetical protein ACOXZZ_06985 [Sphaerochaetaceae bacterium]|jgi:hypothetical protein